MAEPTVGAVPTTAGDWAAALEALFHAAAAGDEAAVPMLGLLADGESGPHLVRVERSVRPASTTVRELRAGPRWRSDFVPCIVTRAGFSPADAEAMAMVTRHLNGSGLDVVETHVAAGALVSLYAPEAVDLRTTLMAVATGEMAAAGAVYEACLGGLERYVETADGAIQEALARSSAGALPRRFDLAHELAATVADLPTADLREAAAAAQWAWTPVLEVLSASRTRRTLYYDAKPANFIRLRGTGGRPYKVDADLMLHTSTVTHQAVVSVFTYPIPPLRPGVRDTYRYLRDLALAWLRRYGVSGEELDLQLVFHLCRRVLAKSGVAPSQARAMAPYALLALERLSGPAGRELGTLVERAAA